MTSATAELTFLDCGAWVGDGKSLAAQRPFALVCGQMVLLCEFSGTKPVELLKDGAAEEIEPINRLLSLLGGPMRLDVCVHEMRRMEVPLAKGIHVFLPEMHLPLVPRLPDVDPDLVPDPSKATCPCHGPVITRMLYGSPDAPSRYRAVSAPLSRNPNDWFYWLAESYRAVADDLIKFLDRLGKYNGSEPIRVIQLGALCEVWQGYRCVVQGMGRAAFVKPTVVDHLGPEKLLTEWSSQTIATRSRDAAERLVRLQRKGAVLLHASETPAIEVSGSFVAEVCSPAIQREPPSAFLALREQQARLLPPQMEAPQGFLLGAISQAITRTAAIGAPLYVTSGAEAPLLSTFRYPRLHAAKSRLSA